MKEFQNIQVDTFAFRFSGEVTESNRVVGTMVIKEGFEFRDSFEPKAIDMDLYTFTQCLALALHYDGEIQEISAERYQVLENALMANGIRDMIP